MKNLKSLFPLFAFVIFSFCYVYVLGTWGESNRMSTETVNVNYDSDNFKSSQVAVIK